MVSNRVYVDHLRGVELFREFSRKDLELVAKAGAHMSVKAGTKIIEQGASGYDAYVVLSGQVRIQRNGRSVAMAGAGTVIGELSLLDRGPRTATAVCETDCDLLVLSRNSFITVLEAVPVLTHKLMRSLASRIRDLDRRSHG